MPGLVRGVGAADTFDPYAVAIRDAHPDLVSDAVHSRAVSTADRARELAERLGVTFEKDIRDHEIDFYDAFSRSGHKFTPIHRDEMNFLPAAGDFTWEGQTLELKSILVTDPEAKHLYRPIRDSVKKGTAQGVDRTKFMIDLRGQDLTDELREALETYNTLPQNQGAKVTRLFVFTQGEVIDIDLI